MSGTATNRTNIGLPAELSKEILQKTQEASAIMQLARKIELPGVGAEIPVITSDPAADWVSETAAKPVANPGLSKKIMSAYKLAVIVPFSNEFPRDANALYNALVGRLPNALAAQFDATVIGGTAPGSNFDVLTACQAQEVGFAGYIAAMADIADNGGDMNGIILSPQAKAATLGATDLQGRPLFIADPSQGNVGVILGAKTLAEKAAHVSGVCDGVAGDWSQAVWGTVEGVKIDFSEDATLDLGSGTTINLFQQNMFAVRAEIEVGFRADTSCFNLLTVTEESAS